MGDLKASARKVRKKKGEEYLITLSGWTANEEEEAKVIARAIDKVRDKVNLSYMLYAKFIPLHYALDPITDEPRLRSLLIVG
jgi:hypothetical protein